MSEKTETIDELLVRKVCCLACEWKGDFGELILTDTARCPECKSSNTQPIEGQWPDFTTPAAPVAVTLKPCHVCGNKPTQHNYYQDECFCGNSECYLFEKVFTHKAWNHRLPTEKEAALEAIIERLEGALKNCLQEIEAAGQAEGIIFGTDPLVEEKARGALTFAAEGRRG